MSSSVSLCTICEGATNKYKCPKCLEPYCSLQCYKIHKESKCAETAAQKVQFTETSVAEEEPTCYEPFTTEDTVPTRKLEMLKDSEELRALLCNRHLRNLLKEIDVAPNAWAAMRAAMQEPLFTEFADVCLKVVEDDETGQQT